jgi:hypothetical protein
LLAVRTVFAENFQFFPVRPKGTSSTAPAFVFERLIRLGNTSRRISARHGLTRRVMNLGCSRS